MIILTLTAFVGLISASDPLERFDLLNREIFNDESEIVEPSITESLLFHAYDFFEREVNNTSLKSLLQIDDIKGLLDIGNISCSIEYLGTVWNRVRDFWGLYTSLNSYMKDILRKVDKRCKIHFTFNILQGRQLKPSRRWFKFWRYLIEESHDDSFNLRFIFSDQLKARAIIDRAFERLVEEYILDKEDIHDGYWTSMRYHDIKNDINEFKSSLCLDVNSLIIDMEILSLFLQLVPQSSLIRKAKGFEKVALTRALICNQLRHFDTGSMVRRYATKRDKTSIFHDRVFHSESSLTPYDIHLFLWFISDSRFGRESNRNQLVEAIGAESIMIPFDDANCTGDEMSKLVKIQASLTNPNLEAYYQNYISSYISGCLDNHAKRIYGILLDDHNLFYLFDDLAKLDIVEGVPVPNIPVKTLRQKLSKHLFPNGLPINDPKLSMEKLSYKIGLLKDQCRVIVTKIEPFKAKYLELISNLKDIQLVDITKRLEYLTKRNLVGSELCSIILQNKLNAGNLFSSFLLHN